MAAGGYIKESLIGNDAKLYCELGGVRMRASEGRDCSAIAA